MEQIEKEIKEIIIEVSGLNRQPEDLDDETTLDELGYITVMCNALASKLRKYIQSRHSSGNVENSDITPDITIEDVVKLVIAVIEIIAE